MVQRGARGSSDAAPGDREPLEELARYRALVEHAPDAIVILDVTTGCFDSVNSAAERLFGLDRAALLQVGPVEVSPPVQPDGRPSAEAAAAYVAEALAGGRPRFEWVHRRADGTDVPCEVALLQLPSTDRRLVRGSVLDIRERKEAERARRVAAAEHIARQAAEADAARLQAMVAGLNAIVWERDPRTWEFRFVSERVQELLGYPAEEWLADPDTWRRAVHPDDQGDVVRAVREGIATAQDYTLTYRMHTADGRLVWVHHLAHVVRDETGEPRAVHAALFDVTEQKRREASAELLAAASRVLAAPGTLEQRLAAVAGLAVGDLCDRATVWLREDDGRYRAVASSPAESAAEVLALAPVTTPPELEARYLAGRPFVIPEVTEEMRRTATEDDAQYEAVRTLGTRSILVTPLVTGGRVVGALTWVSATVRDRDAADLALAGELGQRIATMVAAEKVATRERRLHEITAALSGAGSVAEAGAEVSAGLRRALGACVVVVCTLGEADLLHLVHALGCPPDLVERIATMRLTAPLPVAEAARTGRPVWLPDRQAWEERFPLAGHSWPEGTEAGVALPLRAGGRIVGVLGAGFPTRRDLDPGERAFLLTLASQVAVAVERATLADARREIADTLQSSLLPHSLPLLDRLSLTARYLPGARGTQAGGDWYEVLPLDDRGVALVVGDVVGNGAAAAGVMGQLRSALAAVLLEGHAPARALELLDGFADRVDGAHVSTVACLLLDPVTGRLTYSVAGHLPPLVVDGTGAHHLEGGWGPALALPGHRSRAEATTTLTGGSTLLLYTDGLVERRGAVLDDGLAELASAAAGLRTAGPAQLVDGLLERLVGGDPADDVAVVAVRLLPSPLRLDLGTDLRELRRVRQEVAAWAEGTGVAPAVVDDLQLAAGEAVANAVEHAHRDDGSGRTVLELVADANGGLRVTVADTGRWRPPPGDPGFRGRGLQIIQRLAEDVVLRHGPHGTTMGFRLAPRVVADPGPRARPGRESRPASVRQVLTGRGGCLELIGDLDLAGVKAVREGLLAALTADRDRPTVLDLGRLGHLSSIGVGLLLEVAGLLRRGGAEVDVVLPPDGPARRLLDISGLTDALRGG